MFMAPMSQVCDVSDAEGEEMADYSTASFNSKSLEMDQNYSPNTQIYTLRELSFIKFFFESTKAPDAIGTFYLLHR